MNAIKKSKFYFAVIVCSLWINLVSAGSRTSWPTEEEALIVAEEVKVMITVATNIIGELQPIINGGSPAPSEVEKGHLLAVFMRNYAHLSGAPFDSDALGLLGEARREFIESYKDVLQEHQEELFVGGVDSFVPAYFRSEVFANFNERLGGKVKGYATNREDDLLNPDWGIDALMDYSLFAFYIQELLETQGEKPLLKSVAGRVVGYYPMKLKQSCVACHARQGLEQEVGAFGGALVTEVLLVH